jgi:hypothetical protein
MGAEMLVVTQETARYDNLEQHSMYQNAVPTGGRTAGTSSVVKIA